MVLSNDTTNQSRHFNTTYLVVSSRDYLDTRVGKTLSDGRIFVALVDECSNGQDRIRYQAMEDGALEIADSVVEGTAYNIGLLDDEDFRAVMEKLEPFSSMQCKMDRIFGEQLNGVLSTSNIDLSDYNIRRSEILSALAELNIILIDAWVDGLGGVHENFDQVVDDCVVGHGWAAEHFGGTVPWTDEERTDHQLEMISEVVSLTHEAKAEEITGIPETGDYRFVLTHNPTNGTYLSEQEYNVLRLKSDGLGDHEIASRLDIEYETVRTYYTRRRNKKMKSESTLSLFEEMGHEVEV